MGGGGLQNWSFFMDVLNVWEQIRQSLNIKRSHLQLQTKEKKPYTFTTLRKDPCLIWFWVLFLHTDHHGPSTSHIRYQICRMQKQVLQNYAKLCCYMQPVKMHVYQPFDVDVGLCLQSEILLKMKLQHKCFFANFTNFLNLWL